MQAKIDYQINRRKRALSRCFEILMTAYEGTADQEKTLIPSDILVSEDDISMSDNGLKKPLSTGNVLHETLHVRQQFKGEEDEQDQHA